VTNNELDSTTVSYTDCQTGIQFIVIPGESGESFCSCDNPVPIPPSRNITVSLEGPCIPTPP
jgi:hypothetical protein